MLMITTHGDSSGIGGRGERESSQRSHDGDEHKLRSEEEHVGQFEMMQSDVRPVAEMKR